MDIYPFNWISTYLIENSHLQTGFALAACLDPVLSVGFLGLLDCSLPFDLLQSVLHLLQKRYFVLKLKRRPLIGKDSRAYPVGWLVTDFHCVGRL